MERSRNLSASTRDINHWLNRHPLVIIAHVGNAVLTVTQLVLVFVSLHPQFSADISMQEQMMWVGAQILTGLFGVTMTGYVFFLGRIDDMVRADHTVADVAEMLKKQFNHRVWFVSTVYLLTLLDSGLTAYLKNWTAQIPNRLLPLLYNEALYFAGADIIFILYFIVNVVDPDNLRRAADRLRKRLEEDTAEAGDTAWFLNRFSQLEEQLSGLLPATMRGMPLGQEQISLLTRQGLLPAELQQTADWLRRYQSCVLHGTGTFVSRRACADLQKVLDALSERTESETKTS